MSDDETGARRVVDELEQRLGAAIRGSFSAQATRVLAEQLVAEGWTKPETRAWSLEASQRASRDATELTEHLQRCQNQGLVHGTREQQENTARDLVTWGWTRIGPGEQITRRPTPRDPELDLRDELAATIVGSRLFGEIASPVALAEYLVGDGWVKLGPDEKVVTPMSIDEATQIVAAAFQTWETLKRESRKRLEPPARCPVCNEGYDSLVTTPGKKAQFVHHISLDGKDFETHEFWWPQAPAVSADSSELTATVKPEDRETRILSIFATAPRAFSRVEALTLASGKATFGVSESWAIWNESFRKLQDLDLLELAPDQRPGAERTYLLTDAGRIMLAGELGT